MKAGKSSPEARPMRELAFQSALLAGILIFFCCFFRAVSGNTYTAYIPLPPEGRASSQLRMAPDGEDRGDFRLSRRDEDSLVLRIRPEHRGPMEAVLTDEQGRELSYHSFRVSPFLTVYDESTGGFTGDTVLMAAVTLFCLGESFLMYRAFRRTKGTAFYAYSTIYTAGFSCFLLLTGILLLFTTVRRLLDPERWSMFSVYEVFAASSSNYMVLTSPFILAFALAMIVSNVALLRHERRRFQNFLGLLVGGALIAGEAAGFWLFFMDFTGSETEYRVFLSLRNIYATVFIYFECMLVGSIICGRKAARHMPPPDRDYVLILGCGFRPDGTLPPLLRGRVDCALDFLRRQQAHKGPEATLIPSGGRGPLESMPEAEAMRRYLVKAGFPESRILPEDQSLNTYQNMLYSKKLIGESLPEARVAFATTNYHVFRSGIWANRAGLPAEGMGSKTVWWFWPNAFMREVAGLLAHRWKQELLFLLLLAAFFGLLSMAV